MTGAAKAVFRSLWLAGRKRYLLWAYENVPGAEPLSEWLYERVAENRGTLDKVDLWLIPNPLDAKRSYRLTRSLFLRGMGVIYLIAFLSLYVQVDGLIGSGGILPVGNFLTRVKALSQLHPFWTLPTLCWWDGSDAFLHFLCLGGAGLACLLIVGLMPVPVLALLWLFYLSLVNVGQVFLGYQWDGLLLEAGFLSIFFAPLHWRIEAPAGPSRSCGLSAEMAAVPAGVSVGAGETRQPDRQLAGPDGDAVPLRDAADPDLDELVYASSRQVGFRRCRW